MVGAETSARATAEWKSTQPSESKIQSAGEKRRMIVFITSARELVLSVNACIPAASSAQSCKCQMPNAKCRTSGRVSLRRTHSQTNGISVRVCEDAHPPVQNGRRCSELSKADRHQRFALPTSG